MIMHKRGIERHEFDFMKDWGMCSDEYNSGNCGYSDRKSQEIAISQVLYDQQRKYFC